MTPSADAPEAPHPPPKKNCERPTVNLKDCLKIALAIGLLSLGVQLYAGAADFGQDAAPTATSAPAR